MDLKKSLRPAALAATLALAAVPAFAQHGEDHDRQQRGAEQRGEHRGGEQRAQPRGDEQRGGQRGGEQRAERGTTGRNDGEYRGRNEGRGYAVPRTDNYRSRAYVEPRAYGYERPHAEIRVRHYDRPYFFFRPRYVIGYGLYIGYPVPYPVTYGAPTYVYGYPYGEATAIPPNSYGGVSLDVTPDDAQVSIDGSYVGVARDFSPSYQPLTLTPGRHHIELQAADAVPLAFDVDVVPGEVIPYRGALQPE